MLTRFMEKTKFDPLHWYWSVEGNAKIWSSERLAYIDANDRAYKQWQDADPTHHHPTKIAAHDLVGVMQMQVQPFVMATGLKIDAPAKLAGTYSLDDAAHAQITAQATSIAAGRPLPGGKDTFNFPDSANHMHAFTASEFLAFAHACDNFVYNWTDAITSLIMGKGGTLPGSVSLS